MQEIIDAANGRFSIAVYGETSTYLLYILAVTTASAVVAGINGKWAEFPTNT